jgi:hypothetical protein
LAALLLTSSEPNQFYSTAEISFAAIRPYLNADQSLQLELQSLAKRAQLAVMIDHDEQSLLRNLQEAMQYQNESWRITYVKHQAYHLATVYRGAGFIPSDEVKQAWNVLMPGSQLFANFPKFIEPKIPQKCSEQRTAGGAIASRMRSVFSF